MPIPKSKKELLEDIEHNFNRLLSEYESIPSSLNKERTLEGHRKNTLMSIHDLMAYQVGWHETVLNWHEVEKLGLRIDFPAPNFKWNELGELAQKFYTDYESSSYIELLELLKKTKSDIINLVSSHSDDELYGLKWYKNYTRGRMIQFNTSSPYKNAHARIRKWKKAKGI